MDSIFSSAGIAAASADASSTAESNIATALVVAAKLLVTELERGPVIDAQALRTAMMAGFGGSDAEGGWGWKIAYDACEAAEVLFLRKFGPAMRARAGSAPELLPMLAKIATLLPSHTRRSEESQALQQFSTPIALGFVASIAAAMTAADLVLEPSAGTGLLAIFAEPAGAGFGTDMVAEITGRSRRIVRKTADGFDRLAVESRVASANVAEAQAFMDDEKGIFVFSDAGSTGRSYHADLAAKNQRLRVDYLLEAGWKADTAIQGLGRSNRTNQALPPLFRPIAPNVKAEKRFLSTIARRLDTLGAITKGQRQTGGQGLFRADDNLESVYARAALRQLYMLIYSGKVEGCSLQAFEDATDLQLTDNDGSLREDLPPITTFLNRLLALTIDLQDTAFGVFDDLLRTRIEGAVASGTYDVGVETVTAESLVITDRRTLYVHPTSGAETQVFTIKRRDRNHPVTLGKALEYANDPRARLLVNGQSGRAAVQVPASSLMLDDGEVERRVRLLRPMERIAIPLARMAQTHWQEVDQAEFARAWQAEIAAVPEFTDSEFHIVTGLLLPIWKQLPDDSVRVYRLQTDAGERVIGRLVSPAWVATLTPADAFTAVLDGRTVLQLQDGLALRRTKVMGDFRIELSGFTDGMVDRLKAFELVSEIISWKLRLFVPTGASGPAILANLLERYTLVSIADKAAA